MAGFAASISGQVAKRKDAITAIFKGSTQDVIELMQLPRSMGGNMRVDTGFLRASLRAGVGAVNFTVTANPTPPRAEEKRGTVIYPTDSSAVSLVIAGAGVGDAITAVFTANYARAREYKGDGFLRLSVQQWPRIVAENVKKAEAALGL